jgi:hypothetical protein
MISRLNYEIWFLDYHEGSLNSDAAEQLFSFLDENPDLKQEFDNFEILRLENENSEFKHKNKLHKTINLPLIEGLNEFEILAVKKIENDITSSEEEILTHLTSISPERSKEFSTFKLTKLKPDTNAIYPNKDILKKETGIFRRIYAYSGAIAAAIVLVLFFFSLIRTPGNEVFDYNNNDFATTKNSLGASIASADLVKLPDSTSSFDTPIDNKGIAAVAESSTPAAAKKQPVKTHKQQISDAREEKELLAQISSISTIKPIETPAMRNPITPVIAVREQSHFNETELAFADNTSSVPTLTPREFMIKTVKNTLEIDNQDYSKVNSMELLAASVNKTGVASMDYKNDPSSDSRKFSFNMGNFGVSRSW